MNKGLALRFLRVVNETGLNGWGQVYARKPFEDEEEVNKGALFGAVYSSGESDPEVESEMMVWVDEYYNGVLKGGNLGDFWEKFSEKFENTDSVWVWVTLEQGKRKVRMVRSGESGIVISRDGKRVEVMGKSGEGKVIAGEIFGGDGMLIWAGGLVNYLNDLEDQEVDEEERVDGVVGKLIKNQVGAAGLMLRFGEVEQIEDDEETQGMPVEEKKEIVERLEPIIDESSEWKQNSVTEQDSVSEEIVSDRLVGFVKPKDRVINWWKRFVSKGGVRVGRQENDKKKKLAVGFGLLFLILLSGSVVMGSIKLKNDREEARWAAFSEPIEKKRLEAENMAKINLVGSKKLLEEAKAAFESGKGEFVNTNKKERLAALELKLGQSWEMASGEKESQLVGEINFGLVREGFVGAKFAWDEGDRFLVLDSGLGVVASVETGQKEIKIIAGKGEGQGWVDVVPQGKTGYILGGGGLGLIEEEVEMVGFDSTVSNPAALGAFGTNLYLLDKGNKEIYKYGISGGEVGERQRWLKQGEVIELATPADLAIDGDVWLVGETSEVERFRRGARENFTLSGAPEGASFSRVAVEVEGEKGALLDKVHGWIVVFKKEDGGFVSQLKSERFKEASDIEFDGEGRLWVLIKGMMAEVK